MSSYWTLCAFYLFLAGREEFCKHDPPPTWLVSVVGGIVGIATCYGLDGPGIESQCARDFPHPSKPAPRPTQPPIQCVESSWNVMAHGDAREGKWSGNWRMEWVASTLTLPRNMVYPALLPLMRTPRLPAVDWNDASADLNGLIRFAERRNVVSARVPSRFKRSLPGYSPVVKRLEAWR